MCSEYMIYICQILIHVLIQWVFYTPMSCSKYCRAGVDELSVKSQIVNMLGFWGHVVSITTTQLFHSSTKATRENE